MDKNKSKRAQLSEAVDAIGMAVGKLGVKGIHPSILITALTVVMTALIDRFIHRDKQERAVERTASKILENLRRRHENNDTEDLTNDFELN